MTIAEQNNNKNSSLKFPLGDLGVKPVELRSEEVHEVLGAVPHWILRWGLVILSIIVFILLIGSWFFKYPDTITATMTLTGSTPPAAIVAKTNGPIKEFYIKDGNDVKENDYLAVIENPASTTDMLYLKHSLDSLSKHPDKALSFYPQRELQLGSVHGLYSSFIRALHNYQKFMELNYYPQKLTSIGSRIASYKQYYQGMLRQQKIIEQQYKIAETQFNRDSLLNKKDVLSGQDMDIARNQYLQSQHSLESGYSSLENLQMQISQMEETLLDTEQQYLDNKSRLETELTTFVTQLINEINTWEINYVLSSPIGGKITFTSYWSQNQNVTAGETVFTIIPENNQGLIGKALLPIARSGKVKVGQKVNIYFLNYPDEEFGMVRGIVKSISLVPVKENYTVEISLPQGLMTTYKKELPFSQEMNANAEIITEDLRLLERFLLPIKKIFKEHL